MTEHDVLSTDDLDILALAKQANPWWFRSVIDAATVMGSRVKKYSPGDNPFINFEIAADIKGDGEADVFLTYLALKLARIRVNQQDYPDESFQDSLIDLANYSLLWCGYNKKLEESNG